MVTAPLAAAPPLAASEAAAPGTPVGRVRPRLARAVELLMVGGATPLCFVVSWLLRESLPFSTADLVVGFTFFHLAFIVNDPHFSVTYLLFYEDFRDRAWGRAFSASLRLGYLLAGLAAPVVLLAWGFGAVVAGSAEALGGLLQLMLLLVGWHYVKQGFGVMVVLSARRGLRFSTLERRVVLAHCYAGWAFAWANPAKVASLESVKGTVYTGWTRPAAFESVALAVLVASSVALVAVLIRKWRSEGRLPLFTPLVALLSSIWCWLVFSAADPLVIYMTPALHSLQYLYFVWLLKRNEAASRTGEPYYEPPPRERLAVLAFVALGLGWLLFHAVPTALDDLFAPDWRADGGANLGPTPFFAALYAAVNIHHYLMDAVIWRRDNPRTRYLLAD